jgi:hypothetical protein
MSVPIGVSSVTVAWRNRGYQDALQGREKSKLVPEEHQQAYLTSYRRGRERLRKIERDG